MQGRVVGPAQIALPIFLLVSRPAHQERSRKACLESIMAPVFFPPIAVWGSRR